MFHDAVYKYDYFSLEKLIEKRQQIINTITMLKGKRGKREKESLIKFNKYLEVIDEAIKLKEG